MALTLGPVIGTVGGATWEETEFSFTNLLRLEARTVTSVAPPPPAESVVLLVDVEHTSTVTSMGTLEFGSTVVPLASGANRIIRIVSSATEVRVVAGSTSFGTQYWHFTGSVFTMPFPG